MNFLFEKTLPAYTENISALSQPVLHSAREQGLAEDKLIKLDLALEEIMVNIIKYAYPENSAGGNIMVACGLKTASGKPLFAVEITDTGYPFNVTDDAPSPDINADIDRRQIGGLGILLVKKTMDMVSYHRVKNKNILTLGVFLQAAKNTATETEE